MVVDCHALRARNDEWIATPFGLAMTAFRHRERREAIHQSWIAASPSAPRNDCFPSSRGPNGPVAIHRPPN